MTEISSPIYGTIPDVLYKYRSWTDPYQKSILTEQEIFLSSPRRFNDPYDCRIPVRYDLMTDEEMIERNADMFAVVNPNMPNSEIQILAKKAFDDETLWCKSKLAKQGEDYFEKLHGTVGVVSLSSIRNNTLMWSHYADSHRGFCVGFHSELLFDTGHFGSGQKVDYCDELPVILPTREDGLQIVKQIYSKESKWEYEKEYRLTTMHSADKAVKIQIEAYKEVILGGRMLKEQKDEIISVIKNQLPHVEIYQVQYPGEAFDIEIIPVN
ncbi:MAG: DUF2971 domain-containing protein [Bacteroidia bacterium]